MRTVVYLSWYERERRKKGSSATFGRHAPLIIKEKMTRNKMKRQKLIFLPPEVTACASIFLN
jgi:hypothetical protein